MTSDPGARLPSIFGRLFLKIDYLVYLRLVVPTVAFLPSPLAYGIAIFRADLVSRWSPLRQDVTYSLQLLYGGRFNAIERDRIARDLFRIRSCEPIDTARLLGNGKKLLRLVEVRGLQHLKAVYDDGRGAILASAHIGSPRNCFSIIGALGFPTTVVARWTYGRGSGKGRERHWLYRRAFHHRGPNIERREGNYGVAVQIASVLRQGGFVGLMIDSRVGSKDPSKPSEFEFLDRKAKLVPGATAIAQLMGVPLVLVLVLRSADWRHLILEVSEPIRIEGDSINAFKKCLAVVEDTVRQNPAQWTQLHLRRLLQLGILSEEEVVFEARVSRSV